MEFELLLIIILFVFIFLSLVIYKYVENEKINKLKNNDINQKLFIEDIPDKDDDSLETCTKSKCDSIDPVSDPKYNMHQIIKQSILLEEHLANKNKRCRDCITKHFSHIIGLAEEAVMLACSDVNMYPHMKECPDFYNNLFKRWLADNTISLEVCKELRIMRKKLIAVYFFDENYALDKTDDKGV